MRSIAAIALAVLAPTLASATHSDQSAPKAEDEFRAGWVEFARPTTEPPEERTRERVEQARSAALEHMEGAVAADPTNLAYQTSLVYASLAAGKHAQAKEAADRAIDRKKDDPVLYLLRGQAAAVLACADPAKAGERIGPVLEDFDEAALLDPANALPLLQGASVALEAGRADLARPRIERALVRPRLVFHRLPVPFDLYPKPEARVRAWQYVQYGWWLGMVARCENVTRTLLQMGEERRGAEDLDAAETHFREALELARKVGGAEPSLVITTNEAINMMEDAYARLLRVAEAKESHEAERWRGELGVLQVGRAQLQGALQGYLKQLAEGPPESVEDLLRLEAESVEPIVLGIGLTPPGSDKTASTEATE